MGQPTMLKAWYPPQGEELTPGTETSKYREEEKTIVISLVVASERERAQIVIVSAITRL